MKKYWLKTGCITAIGVMSLVPAMSFIEPIADQPDESPKIVKYVWADGELHKAVLAPILVDATGTVSGPAMFM